MKGPGRGGGEEVRAVKEQGAPGRPLSSGIGRLGPDRKFIAAGFDEVEATATGEVEQGRMMVPPCWLTLAWVASISAL